MIWWFIFTCQFFLFVTKHIKWRSLSKRVIHELSEEVMNFNQLTTFDFDVPPEIFEPWNDWENEYEKLPQVCALCFSVFEWTFSLSLWSSVISNLTNCYFLGYWRAPLKQNTEWSGQETTSRGSFYSTFQILVLRRCST